MIWPLLLGVVIALWLIFWNERSEWNEDYTYFLIGEMIKAQRETRMLRDTLRCRMYDPMQNGGMHE